MSSFYKHTYKRNDHNLGCSSHFKRQVKKRKAVTMNLERLSLDKVSPAW
jgi:IS1 family transposase